MEIEWGEEKRKINIRQHQIDFLDVVGLFENPLLERIDEREDYGEMRLSALGELAGRVFYIAYTWRGDNVRLISVRKATSREKSIYYASHPCSSEEDEG